MTTQTVELRGGLRGEVLYWTEGGNVVVRVDADVRQRLAAVKMIPETVSVPAYYIIQPRS